MGAKADIAVYVAKQANINLGNANRAIGAVFDFISNELAFDNTVELRGFGTFFVKETIPRTGRNPSTGEPVDIPSKNRVRFRASKALNTLINGE